MISSACQTRAFVSRPCATLLAAFIIATFASFASGPGSRALAGEDSGSAPAEKKSLSTAPDFTGKGVDGKTYQLKELLKNGPVLLDFWTTWCKPCMVELPKLQEVYEKYKDRGFTLVGIPSDDQKSAAKIKPMIQSKKFNFPNVPDTDRKIGNLYNVRNFPTTVLIAPDGSISVVAQGYRPGDEKELEEKIAALLGGGETPN